MGFTFKHGYSIYDEKEGEELVFQSLNDLKKYTGITQKQLVDWNNDMEAPENYSMLSECIIVKGPAKKAAASTDVSKSKKILTFKTSRDGNHWESNYGFFSSTGTLIEYVAFYLADEWLLEEEEIQEMCKALKKDNYAKWVNPEDKKEKLYIVVESIDIDMPYYKD